MLLNFIFVLAVYLFYSVVIIIIIIIIMIIIMIIIIIIIAVLVNYFLLFVHGLCRCMCWAPLVASVKTRRPRPPHQLLLVPLLHKQALAVSSFYVVFARLFVCVLSVCACFTTASSFLPLPIPQTSTSNPFHCIFA